MSESIAVIALTAEMQIVLESGTDAWRGSPQTA